MSHDELESAPGSRVREQIDGFCEKGILGLFLAILVVGTLAIGGVRPSEFAFIQALTVGIMGLWGVRIWANGRFRLLWPPVCWAVLGFLAYALFRCRWVELEYPARLELNQVLVYGALFFALMNNVSRRQTTTVICLALIVLGAAVSVFAIYQVATHNPRIFGFIKPEIYHNRGSGTFINPNHLAGFLAMIVPIALSYAIMGRFKPVTKVLMGYASLVLIGGVAASISRAGIIAAALATACFLIFLVFQRDYRLRALAMLGVLGFAAIIIAKQAASIQHRFAPGLEVFADFQDGRVAYWSMATQLFNENASLGIGPAHFKYMFWREAATNLLSIPEYVHNEYLQTLCEWGVVGLALIAVFLVLLVWGIFRTWPHVRRDPHELGGKNSTKAAFLMGAFFGVLAMLLHSVFDFDMHIPILAIVAITLTALIANQLRFATERYWANPGKIGKGLITIVLLAGAVYLGDQAWSVGREHVLLNQAKNAQPDSKEKEALLKRAVLLEPTNPDTAYALGECLYLQSQRGNSDYKVNGVEALSWYARSMQLNPYFPFAPLRYGMCLDWLDRSSEATPYFDQALALYPKSAMIPAYQGWHYMQMEDFAKARKHLNRSIDLRGSNLAFEWLHKLDAIEAQLPPQAAGNSPSGTAQ